MTWLPDAPEVLKFGGSTFRTEAGYPQLAAALDRRLTRTRRPLVVVVSAMSGETERLRARLLRTDPQPQDATLAGLVTLADTVSAQLLAAALQRSGRSAVVLAGHQLGLCTDSTFLWARLEAVDPAPLRAALAEHEVVVVPGGQAVDRSGRPTWLGKNSSDLSAVVLAMLLEAPRCTIHSDVDGVYSADPNLLTGARLMGEVSYRTAELMSQYGAKVLHRGAVALARRRGIEIVCRLNRPPYRSGTTIAAGGGGSSAVVVDRRAVALAYPDEPAAAEAHQTLCGAGVEAVRVGAEPIVAVGGYLDHEAFHRGAGLRPGRPVGVPVTVVRPDGVDCRIAADPTRAVRLAQRLHDELYPDPLYADSLHADPRVAPRTAQLEGV
ncbi:aspartate kinase [Kitasatospora sp. MAP12-15]|uniref:amino acid kinase family protein n=1 Tax=unclassified Kitasatospora TaxID=2633591 RepID=UPI0024735587|nr:aspartate kinase [Kitasatospora sp. MAP12-44]MDH6111049.1 aspartate kinase [Kitasatospora sp. MAP12-44]